MRFFRNALFLAAVCSLLVIGSGLVMGQDDMAYEEYPVFLENGVAGIIVDPAGDEPAPAVLMLHGFASHKDEVGDMYKRLAASLGERGIGSLRIDFRGWGESEGAMTESTLPGMVDDAAAAYDYLAAQDFVDSEQIGLIGFSLGGRVAVASAGQNPDWYQSLVLWSTGGDLGEDFMGQETADTAAEEGTVTVDLGFTVVELGSDFFTTIGDYSVEDEFPKYSGSFLVIAGTEDESHEALDWYLSNAQGELRAGYSLEGGDHIYSVLTDDQTDAENVIQTTSAWFGMT